MKPKTRAELKAAGWRVGTSDEFLGLSPEESLLVEIKLTLADALRARRTKLGLTQQELARKFASSQSRIAKMEAADGSVTIDLLVFALAGLGATRKELARILNARAA